MTINCLSCSSITNISRPFSTNIYTILSICQTNLFTVSVPNGLRWCFFFTCFVSPFHSLNKSVNRNYYWKIASSAYQHILFIYSSYAQPYLLCLLWQGNFYRATKINAAFCSYFQNSSIKVQHTWSVCYFPNIELNKILSYQLYRRELI